MIIRKTFPQVYKMEDKKTGNPYFLVSARSAKWGMNQRKSFDSEDAALDHARAIASEIVKNGAQTNMPKEKVAMADAYQKLIARLTPYGKCPEEAAEHYLKFLANEVLRQVKPSISELADKWKAFKYEDTSLSKKTVIEIRSYARFIKSKWGNSKPDDLKKNDIDLLLKRLKVSNNTRRKYLRYIRMFLSWVKDEHFITANPTDGLYYKPDDYSGDFYTPSQIKALLLHVIDTKRDLVGYYSLLTFAGLRPSEGARVRWEDINLKTNQLYVRKGKTQARYITLENVALQWIKFHRENTPHDKPFVELKNLANREKEVRAFLNGEWKQDGLRHGFGTYYKALTKNIETVADTMGNSVTVVMRHYARAVPADECTEFWALTPTVVLADGPAGT